MKVPQTLKGFQSWLDARHRSHERIREVGALVVANLAKRDQIVTMMRAMTLINDRTYGTYYMRVFHDLQNVANAASTLLLSLDARTQRSRHGRTLDLAIKSMSKPVSRGGA